MLAPALSGPAVPAAPCLPHTGRQAFLNALAIDAGGHGPQHPGNAKGQGWGTRPRLKRLSRCSPTLYPRTLLHPGYPEQQASRNGYPPHRRCFPGPRGRQGPRGQGQQVHGVAAREQQVSAHREPGPGAPGASGGSRLPAIATATAATLAPLRVHWRRSRRQFPAELQQALFSAALARGRAPCPRGPALPAPADEGA